MQGNILTEIQLNTKNLEDIKKVKEKYGEDYSKRITRQGIGVGLLQNPKHNDGKPWFIQFRPTLHSPHKITEEESHVQYKHDGIHNFGFKNIGIGMVRNINEIQDSRIFEQPGIGHVVVIKRN